MNPRFPTPPRYRRHRKSPHPLLRPFLFGLATGGVLFFLFSSKDPEPSSTAKQPAEQAGQQPAPPPVVGPEVKQQPLSPSKLETKSADKAQPNRELEPRGAPLVSMKDTQKTALSPPSEMTPSPEQKAVKKLSVQPLSSPETRVLESLPPPKAPYPKVRKPDIDLTFYKEFSTKKFILPEALKQKRAVPPPLARAPHTPSFPKNTGSMPSGEIPAEKSSQSTSQDGIQDGIKYLVRIAIFSDVKSAKNLKKYLHQRGANPKIVETKTGSGRSIFQVRLGPFLSYTKASRALQLWKINDHPPAIMRISDKNFR